MEVAELRLLKEPDKSFIVHDEKAPFAPWHHHPEYELVSILKGNGRRMVGDNVEWFNDSDLIFVGPYLPHQWSLDDEINDNIDEIDGQAFVIQFSYDFLGENFFEIPEHLPLKEFLIKSERGYKFHGKTKSLIKSIMLNMIDMNNSDRLYALFQIFQLFGSSKEYRALASPAWIHSKPKETNEPMNIALQFVLQNFHRKIQINELLDVTNMSYAAFYPAFKNTYGMHFTDYLLNIRIGYACKLLCAEKVSIAEIAYDSGFENLANFNRRFKKIKGGTPSEYRRRIKQFS